MPCQVLGPHQFCKSSAASGVCSRELVAGDVPGTRRQTQVPSALLKTALKPGRPDWGSCKSPDKAPALCKPQTPGPGCLSVFPFKLSSSDTLNWYRSASKEKAFLCFPSPSTAGWWEWHSAKPCCDLHQDQSASADTHTVSVIPHFTTPAVRKGNGGLGSTTGPVGSSDEWCAVPGLDHCFRAQIAHLSHQKRASFSHKNVLRTRCII